MIGAFGLRVLDRLCLPRLSYRGSRPPQYHQGVSGMTDCNLPGRIISRLIVEWLCLFLSVGAAIRLKFIMFETNGAAANKTFVMHCHMEEELVSEHFKVRDRTRHFLERF